MANLQLSVILSASNQMTAPLRQALNSANALNMGIAAIGAGVGYSIKKAIEFESVMADVGKVVNFDGAKELNAMSAALLKMSTEIPMTAKGLGEIMAAAGSAGIAKNELLQFTRDAAKMGVAFDMSGAEAGAAMTGMRSIFHLTQKEVVSLGDAFNHLSNNMDAKARDMLNIANRTGSTAKIFGLTGQQLGALSATFLALKTPPEIAATGINAMLMKMATADKQNKKFGEALKRLGINATDLKANIGKDAQGALIGFLETVKKAPDLLGNLSDLFGLEYSDDIAKLVGGLDVYKKSLGLVGNATKYAGSMNREYEIRSKTTANAIVLLKNKGDVLAVNLGSLLLPYVNQLVDKLGGWVSGITALAEKYPNATREILGAATALVVLKGVMMVGGFGAALVGDIMLIARSISGVLLPVIQSAWTALMFNPLAGVIILISAAVIGLAALIYANWQPIKAFMGGLFDGLAPLFTAITSSPIWTWIASGVSSAIAWFSQLFLPIQYTSTELNNASNAGKNLGLAISNGILGAINCFAQLRAAAINMAAGWFEIGSQIMAGLGNGITAGAKAVLAKITAVAQTVKASFTGLLGIHSPSRVFVEYGENINQGLAVGLGLQENPLKQTEHLSHALVKKFLESAPQYNVAAILPTGQASGAVDAAISNQAAIVGATGQAASSAGWKLGQTSQVFESGKGGAGTVSSGAGDRGGVSYGTYQLSSKVGTLAKFLQSSQYGQQFQGLSAGSAAFNAKWKQLAASDQNFGAAQHEFIKKTHYDPQMQALKKSGIDLSGKGAAVQDAIWSTSVQFGGGTGLIKKALAGKNAAAMSDAQIVAAIQDYKAANNNSLFSSSSAAVKAGTAKRALAEKEKLLKLAGSGTSAVLPEKTATAVATAKKAHEHGVVPAMPSSGLPSVRGYLPDLPKNDKSLGVADVFNKVLGVTDIVAQVKDLPVLSQVLPVLSKKFGDVSTTSSVISKLPDIRGYLPENVSTSTLAKLPDIRGYLPENLPKSEDSPSVLAQILPTLGGGNAPSATSTQSIVINIHAAEGMDERKLANHVKNEFQKQTRSKSRSGQLFDESY